MVESLMELPPNNIEQILSKLPIKSIVACRCACKTLLNLTSSSNPHFTALHSSNASQNLIIQFGRYCPYTLSNSVHLLDAQLDLNPGSSVEKLPPSPLFELPDWAEKLGNFALVNACNGLLFFAAKFVLAQHCSLVCNPITKEYVRVPEVIYQKTTTSGLWLGFSPNSRVYKVLRIYTYNHSPGPGVIAAHIHDVGSNSWRDVVSTPLDNIYWNNSYAFINGIGYWICQYDSRLNRPPANFIVFFDFESEIFGKIDAPPGFDECRLENRYFMNIGIVGDLLCLIDSTETLEIWVLNKCGEWLKQFSSVEALKKPLFQFFGAVKNPRIGTMLRPLQLLSSGEILMDLNSRNLVCCDMKKENSFRLIDLHMDSSSTLVTFVPSFVSLKDALMGN
ncbi:hypothetical protein BUALT_Bualt18G0083100 [Buddleja alternifolia]|uniref:F-box domain-containing protein n=1 Tax=Buddleja alternifolia TaxID=168488 RepID=A0AAV6W462_9LAMI|nr:hypothetical protein BUALT_Bualt18G0083100 [Buddleja alternifolia]